MMNCTFVEDDQCDALEACYNHTGANLGKSCMLNNLGLSGTISRETFKDWSANVHIMVMSENEIEDVEEGTFQNLPNLMVINMITNWLTEVRPGMFTGLSKLILIGLCHNRITTIRSDAFNGLNLV